MQHYQHTDDYPLSSASLSSLRSLFTSVNTFIKDEISMVSSRKLEQIHLRLQAIKSNELPFGGLNDIIVGDFFQLRPIRAKFAFTHTTLWPLFTPFFLNKNMRQSSDHSFAQLLNRVRIASLNPDDIKLLKSRLISENTHLDLLHIFPLCQQVQLHNYKMQQLLPDEQFLAKAYHYFSDNDATPHNPVLDNSLIPQDDRNACGLPIQLNVSRGTRVMLLRNLNVQYGLVMVQEVLLFVFIPMTIM